MNLDVVNKQQKILLMYLLLSLITMLPLLLHGYILTFDMPWGPRIVVPSLSSSTWLFAGTLKLLSLLFSSMLTQKLMLLSLFVLMGLGAHRLAGRFEGLKKVPQAAYVAGVFYVFNPFVYTRLMAGQWLVLCGYALLPWALGSFWSLMQKPGWRQAARAAAWTAAIGLTSIHAVGFVLLAELVLFKAAGTSNLKSRALWAGAALLGFAALNAVWLVPLLLGHSYTAGQISGFGPGQLQAFATQGTVGGSVPLSAALLEGFWADPQGRYAVPSHLGWWWFIVVGLLVALILAGVALAVKKRDRLGLSLLVLAVIAWWLGMGVGSSWSAGTTHFLVAHLPFYKGYREPQKWLMLLALSYSYFLAVGAAQITGWIKRVEWRQPVVSLTMLLPVLGTPLLLWGAAGQLKSSQYPADWSQAAAKLDADKSNYQVLVLPWHEYLPLSFVGRVVANPADHYFKQPMVISDNLELRGVPPSQSTPLYRLIDNQLLPQRNERTDAAAQLKPYNVKYVLLLKEADWQQYGWVGKQSGWQLVQDSPHLQLYEAKAER